MKHSRYKSRATEKRVKAGAAKWNNGCDTDAGGFLKLTGKEAIKRKKYMDEQRRLIEDQLRGRNLYR